MPSPNEYRALAEEAAKETAQAAAPEREAEEREVA